MKRLRQCGGKSVCETTTILLRTIMTDECATFYNYEGKNNKKLSFKDLNIHEILIGIIIIILLYITLQINYFLSTKLTIFFFQMLQYFRTMMKLNKQ